MENLKVIFFFFALFWCFGAFSQNKVDSLRTLSEDKSKPVKERLFSSGLMAEEYLNQSKPDSALYFAGQTYEKAIDTKLDSIACFSKAIMGAAYRAQGKYESSLEAYNEAISIAQKHNYYSIEASSFRNIGSIYRRQGNFSKALKSYNTSIDLHEKFDNPNSLAESYNGRGILHIIQNNYEQAEKDLNKSIEAYLASSKPDDSNGPLINLAILKTRQGDIAAAIRLYMRSLAISERIGDDFSTANAYSNIANLYYTQRDYNSFFEYSNKGLEIRRKMNDEPGVALILSNMGLVYFDNDDIENALKYYTEALPIAEKTGSKSSVAQITIHLGLIYSRQGEWDLAWKNLNRAIKINEEIGGPREQLQNNMALGYFYKYQGNIDKGLTYFEKALDYAEGTEIKFTSDISYELYDLYRKNNDYEKALKFYLKFEKSKDSLESQINQKEIVRQEFKYEYDKKALADSLAFVSQQQIQAAKLEKTRNQRQSLYIVLAIVLAFSLLLFSRNRTINHQKVTIEHQNSELQDLNENLEEKVVERTKELKESDERYTYAMEASSNGIWDYDVKSDTIKFSPAIYTMLGFEPYEFPESRKAIYNQLYKEDIKIAKRKEHDLFITDNNEEFLTDEYRFLGKDGSLVWVQVKGKIVEKDDNGNPLRIVGTHIDITAEKQKNQELLEAVLKTEDAERSRISKEIHDGLQQTLTVSLLNLRYVKSKYLDEITEKVKDKFDLAWEYLQNGVSESRNVAHALMPKSIEEFGILSACQKLVEDMNDSNEKTEFDFYHNFKEERIQNQQIEITLYRILQEGLNNIIKYANATDVSVNLMDYEDIYVLMIEDNGVGFDTSILQKEGTGLGFNSMKNRLDAIGGRLNIESVVGKGTSILVEIEKRM